MEAREDLGTRLGFLLLSAGCAIGLGNIWRFPMICGKYGGAYFVLFYLAFLLLMGLPLMVMELAIGRGSRRNMAGGFDVLACRKREQPVRHTWWGRLGKFVFIGNLVLMMFYVVITGWILCYTWYYVSGKLGTSLSPAVPEAFNGMVSNPWEQIFWTAVTVFGMGMVCVSGLRSGVERVTKYMMAGLLVLLLALVAHAACQSGTAEGYRFFLKPSYASIQTHGLRAVLQAAAMQAFFTLSLGIGSIAIFGSYTSREKSLTGEAIIIIVLDTFVALSAGMFIFPYCFTYGISPETGGPSLLFIALPSAFANMAAGRICGVIFFLFMSIAALTTVVSVMENIIAYGMDQWHMSRKASSLLTMGCIFVLSIPTVLGFNVWSGFQPLGKGSTVLDLEDFIVSNNLLPLGALLVLLFCVAPWGWGFDRFSQEVNTGKGVKMPDRCKYYCAYVLPVLLFIIWAMGYIK